MHNVSIVTVIVVYSEYTMVSQPFMKCELQTVGTEILSFINQHHMLRLQFTTLYT